MKDIIKILFSILTAGLVYLGARDGLEYYSAYKNQDATPAPTPSPSPSLRTAVTGTPEPISNGNISVSAPGRDAIITLPFSVSGMARPLRPSAGEANVFENTVIIAVKDKDGGDLYRDFTNARSLDTGQLGPFTKTITYFQKPPASQNIVLEVFWNSPKDGESLDVVSIPLVFNASGARSVKVFFGNSLTSPSAVCAAIYPAMRLIASMQAPVAGTIEQLLKGPTPAEVQAGYITAISRGAEMPRIAVAQGTAAVDFAKNILAEDAGEEACRIQLFKTQIERTLYQFPNISGAVISVEGKKY